MVFFPFQKVDFVFYVFLLLFTLRDNFAKNRSLGKMFCSLYIQHTKNNENVIWLFSLLRNLIWVVFYFTYQIIDATKYRFEFLLGFVMATVIYFTFLVFFEQTPLDKILGIKVVEKKLR